jgi:RimJ/RimL family protein N-acetyltransferase
MAAFTAQDPADWAAFQARWMMMRANETTLIRTVLVGETVAGHVYLYEEMGRPEVSYWLGREVWGKGVATRALALFLRQVPVRPIYARVAQDNIASLRVLQKCGFRIIGHDQGFAAARQADVAEYILVREAA